MPLSPEQKTGLTFALRGLLEDRVDAGDELIAALIDAGIGSGGATGPVKMLIFEVDSAHLVGPNPDPFTLGAVLSAFDYQAVVETPDDYWGEDVSATQVPITDIDYAPSGAIILPTGGIYWIEYQLSFTLAVASANGNSGTLQLGGDNASETFGPVSVEKTSTLGLAGFGGIFSPMPGTQGTHVSTGGGSTLTITEVHGYCGLTQIQ